MPSRNDVHYFGAGPAPLPTPVLEEAAQVLLNYKDSGVGIAEISHRSADASSIINGTQSLLRQLLDIPESDGPDGYKILFLHGGGSGEFSAVVYNMVGVWVAKQLKQFKEANPGASGDAEFKAYIDAHPMKLDYFVTGSWSLKASQEAARLVGSKHVNIVTDARESRGGKFGLIPDSNAWRSTEDENECALTYYCDNETVDGVEFQDPPPGHNLVADMSSNFLSRPIDVRKHVAIFGGAQKNIGTTGITIAIVSNRILPPHLEMPKPDVLRSLGLPIGPLVLDWPTIDKNNSLYNTLSIFDVWVAGRVMQRLMDGAASSRPRISAQESESNRKAAMLYEALDSNGDVYSVVPEKGYRSRMNVCFRVKGGNAEEEKTFLKGAESRGLLGVKGHRSVGGMRVSNYNAVPVAAVEKLVQYLNEFAKG